MSTGAGSTPPLADGPIRVPAGTQIIGTYEIVEHLSTGGMGEVYRGVNIHSGDPVAIKIVLPALAHDQMILSLFQKEASTLNRLAHDAIVRYHVFTIDPGIQRPCLVMEFVDGEALSDRMKKGPMAAEDVRAVLIRVAGGLAAAHRYGVVHRDLSPDNVILQDGRVDHAKLIDFGIAKSLAAGDKTLIGNQFAGKYGYVAPEQMGRFQGEVTERTDIYSLGLVAAAACLGKGLDMGSNPASALEKRVSVPDLTGIPADLAELLGWMLQPDPADRPDSMAAVLAVLGGEAEVSSVPPHSAHSVPPGGDGFDDRTRIAGMGGFTTTGAPRTAPRTVPRTGQPVGQPTAPGNQAAPSAAPAPKRRRTLPLILGLVVLGGAGGGVAWQMGLLPAPVSRSLSDTAAAVLPASVAALLPGAPEAVPEGSGDAPPPSAPEAGKPAQAPSAPPAQAASTPPATPPATPPVADTRSPIDRQMDFVRGYDAGACSYLVIKGTRGDSLQVAAFGTSPAPFETMKDTFARDFGTPPDTSVHLVRPDQCAVVSFANDLAASGRGAEDDLSRPRLVLDRDSLAAGQSIRGTITRTGGRPVWLMLVDAEGVVYDLTGQLREEPGGVRRFGLALNFTGSAGETETSLPLMMMAVTSDQVIETAAGAAGVRAAQLMPIMADEIVERGLNARADLAYFRFNLQ
jgi:serine/threonine-protein kinase